jgi:toxin ParE1/3/4
MIIFSPDALGDVARIMTTIEQLQAFPDRGSRTDDADIRQIVIRFGVSGYVVRYAVMPETRDILITRIWHGREAHP